MGKYFIVLKISLFSFYCFQDDEKEKKNVTNMKKKYTEKIRKKNQLEKNMKRKLKLTQMQCRMMSSDIYFILYMDKLSRKRSTNPGL